MNVKRIAEYGWPLLVVIVVAMAMVYTMAPSFASPETPTLSTEQKQAIQILAQRIELAQLRAQAAEAEFKSATGELTALLRSLGKDGYDLNLQTLSYVKKDPAKAPEAKKGGSR